MKIGIVRLNKNTPETEVIEDADILHVIFVLGDDNVAVGTRDGNLEVRSSSGALSVLPRASNCVQVKKIDF